MQEKLCSMWQYFTCSQNRNAFIEACAVRKLEFQLVARHGLKQVTPYLTFMTKSSSLSYVEHSSTLYFSIHSLAQVRQGMIRKVLKIPNLHI